MGRIKGSRIFIDPNTKYEEVSKIEDVKTLVAYEDIKDLAFKAYKIQ